MKTAIPVLVFGVVLLTSTLKAQAQKSLKEVFLSNQVLAAEFEQVALRKKEPQLAVKVNRLPNDQVSKNLEVWLRATKDFGFSEVLPQKAEEPLLLAENSKSTWQKTKEAVGAGAARAVSGGMSDAAKTTATKATESIGNARRDLNNKTGDVKSTTTTVKGGIGPVKGEYSRTIDYYEKKK